MDGQNVAGRSPRDKYRSTPAHCCRYERRHAAIEVVIGNVRLLPGSARLPAIT